jgi:hypothetical protein
VVFLLVIGCELGPEDLDALQQIDNIKEENFMKIVSSDFDDGGLIPSVFTCDGDNVNPNLEFLDVPKKAVSLVLIMDDPDIPAEIKESRGIEKFDHWVLFNIDPKVTRIDRNNSVGISGANSRGESKHTGPCPPTQYEPKEHRYFFKLYALDKMLDLSSGANESEITKAMEGHVIEEAQLVGRYQRVE